MQLNTAEARRLPVFKRGLEAPLGGKQSPNRSLDHGRRRPARPEHHRPFIGVQAQRIGRSGARAQRVVSPRKRLVFVYARLPYVSPHVVVRFSVMLPGWPERRVHILFIRLDRFTSASQFPPLRTLFLPVRLALFPAGEEPHEPHRGGGRVFPSNEKVPSNGRPR